MNRQFVYAGVLGVLGLVAAAIAIATPAAITDLSTPVVKRNGVALSWTAPSDGGNAATEYDLRYSASPIDETNFSLATQITTGTPSSPGQTDVACLDTMGSGSTYWFAIKSYGSGSWSNISNVVSATTPQSGTYLLCP